MKKNKILFLCRLYHPHIGGVEQHVSKVSDLLVRSGKSVTILTEQDSIDEMLYENSDGITIYRIPLPNHQTNKICIWMWVIKNTKLFIDADVIHIHDVFFWILPIYPLLFILNKSIYTTFHGYEANNRPTRNQIAWHRLAAFLSRKNICIGGFHQKWYGVSPTITSFGASEKLETKKILFQNTMDKRIVFAGRLATDTGIMSYLEAIKELNKSYSVHLDVFGNGPLFIKAKNYSETESLPVTFHGFVNANTIQWSKYDAAFASGYLSILACLSSKLPVIAYYDTQIKYDYLVLTPFAQWIFISNSPNEILLNIDMITQNDLSRKINDAYSWALKQTWGKMLSSYLKIWELK